jgi:flagellar biosynthetic protein FliO
MYKQLILAVIGNLVFTSVAFAQVVRTPETEFGPFKVVFGLILVLGLIAALAWALKKLNHAKIGNQSVAKIVGGVNVGTRERVVVIEIGGHWVVVGVAAGHVSSVANFKISDLDFSDGLEQEPQFYDETSGSSAHLTASKNRNSSNSEPKFQFKSEFDTQHKPTEEAFSNHLANSNKSQMTKENMKRILRKLL